MLSTSARECDTRGIVQFIISRYCIVLYQVSSSAQLTRGRNLNMLMASTSESTELDCSDNINFYIIELWIWQIDEQIDLHFRR